MKFLKIGILAANALLQIFLALAKAHWFFELWTHYIHYIAVFNLLATFSLLGMKQKRWALVTAILAVINFTPIFPYLASQTPPDTEPTLSILNSNFYFANEKLDSFIEIFDEHDPDILIIHEATEIWTEAISQEDYPHQALTEVTGIPGIFIASKLPGELTEVPLGNGFGLELRTEDHTILAVHPFPAMSNRWAQDAKLHFADMQTYMEENPHAMLIGDFNAAPWSPKMKTLLKSTDLRDAALGFGLNSTWHSTHPLFHIPIDHALVSEKYSVHNYETLYVEGSDHKTLSLELSFD